MTRLPFRSYYIPIVLLLALLSLTQLYTSAQSPQTNNYTGLDILLLVDQSGSMGGIRYNGAPIYGQGNDVIDGRFLGPQFALDWLGRYENTVVNNPPNIRFSLLTFGDSTRLLLDWIEIGTDTSSTSWAELQDQIIVDISSDRFGNTNLGYTNFQSAAFRTRQIFESTPLLGPDELHYNAVILLTDGAPCVPTPEDPFPNCFEVPLSSQQTHLQGVANYVQQNLPNTQFYIVNLDQTDAYYPPLASSWEEVACSSTLPCTPSQIIQVDDLASMNSQFNLMLADIMSNVSSAGQTQEVAFPPGTFIIPPFTQLVSLNLFKSDSLPVGTVSLQRPDGTTETATTPSGLDTPIETYEVSLPLPGEWTIQIPDADANRIQSFVASFDVITAGANIINPPLQTDMLTPTNFTLEIVDNDGVALVHQSPPDVPQLMVELIAYDATNLQRSNRRQVASTELILDALNAPGINQYTGNITFDTSGQHEIRANVYYINNEGLPIYLLRDEPLIDNFTVNEAYIDWRGLNPTSQRQGASMTLQADLRRTNDQTLLSTASNTGFQVTIFNLDGSQTPAAIYPNQSGTAGEIVTNLQIDTTGSQQLLAELGTILPDGTFQPYTITDATRAYNFTIRPVTDIQLQFTAPLTQTSNIQDPFPYFWQQDPVTIRVELRDFSGNALSLADLTGGNEIRPTMSLQRNNNTYIIDDPLVEIRAGVYEVTTNLPRGQFNLTASITTLPENFLGDFSLAQSSISTTHQRQTAPWVMPTIIGSIVAIVLLVGGIWFFVMSELKRQTVVRENPIRGRITIFVQEDGDQGPQTRNIDLSPFGKNRISISGSNLPGDLKSLILSNGGIADNAQSGVIIVESYRYASETVYPSTTVFDRSEEILHMDANNGVTYILRFEVDELVGEYTGFDSQNQDPI